MPAKSKTSTKPVATDCVSKTKKKNKVEPALMEVLRHHHMYEKPLPEDVCPVGSDGFCAVEDLLCLPSLKDLECNFEVLVATMNNSSKSRFEMIQSGDRWLARAKQGHTIKHGLIPITRENLPPACIHGTYFERYWDSIREHGLSKMGRNHVHFATALDAKSGKRGSCDMVICLNMELALERGLPLVMSANGVILSPGFDGVIPCEFFERAVHLKDGLVDTDAAPIWLE
eukprot:TRINITY_DN5693_c0_g1_i2.p1 TRINITY_DN5693_c0_g1~~TRINITY_DN5693_c0_g1_i2.p1  ORF type:complete len:229 (-),score=26.48 TRINITY_DN5693_c0_g1_i2:92-778(-)